MGAVDTTYTFTATDTITSAKMNNIIDQTTMTSSAIIGTTLEVASGKLKVRSQGITSNELADNSVTTAKILDGNVTQAKTNNSLVPAGAVMPFAMSTAPVGWFFCDGALLSRTTYALLFAAIGTTFGVGDGTTTFAIPDLRGYFVRSLGLNPDNTTSLAIGVKQASANLAHIHTITDAGHFHQYQQPSAGQGVVAGAGPTVFAASVTSVNTTANTTGIAIDSNGGAESRPPNIALLYCIKY